jgi:hypothetical protein
MKFQVVVYWVVTTCSSVVGYKSFVGPCCLYLQGEDVDTAVETSNVATNQTD